MAATRMLFCCLTLAGYAYTAQAQAPPADSQASDAARLVRLNVLAVDSRGQPVGDLSAEDFRVADEGKLQRLSLFRGGGGGQAASPGAHEYSNRPAPAPHSAAILFDFMNENRADRLDAARKIGQSLKQLESGESVYLYLLLPDGKLYPIHAIQKEVGASDKTWTLDIETLLAKAIKSENRTRPAGMVDEEVVKKTYVGLESLANQLAALPGRRDIIWVTNGVPNVWNPKVPCNGDWIDCALYVPHLSVTLERAGVVVNPLSYSGLLDAATNRSMEEMAGLTGGRAYFGDDMRAILKQLTESASATYAIAYDPSRENWDSRFHKVKVSCERKGVKILTRQRYYALPDQRPAAVKEQAALVAAYQSPPDVSDIGLRATVSPAAGSPKTLRVEMRIDAADLMLHDRGGEFDDQLTLLFSARGAGGPNGEPTLSNFNLHLTRPQRETVMKEGIPIAREYPIDDTIQNVRLIVLDRATNSVGSLTVPVSFPR